MSSFMNDFTSIYYRAIFSDINKIYKKKTAACHSETSTSKNHPNLPRFSAGACHTWRWGPAAGRVAFAPVSPKQREEAAGMFWAKIERMGQTGPGGGPHGPKFRMFEMFESHVIIFWGALVLTCCKCWLSCTHCYITHSWRFMYWYLYNAIMISCV